MSAIVVLTLTRKPALSMRSDATCRRARPVSSGFTLFELVVALAVMSIALALVGPVLIPRPVNAEELFADLVSDSRRTATRRAETMQLDVNARGEWTLSNGLVGEPSIVRHGRIASQPRLMRIRISPLGICSASGSPPVRIDPFTCSPPRETGK